MGEYASVTAVYAVENKGATEHKYIMDQFINRFEENYGEMNKDFTCINCVDPIEEGDLHRLKELLNEIEVWWELILKI